MDRATFTRHLVEASERARSFAGDYLLESLPPPIVCRVHLNASYDAGATPAERLYPEDSARGPFLCTRDALVDVLYRDGRVPEWIDLAVVGETGEATVLGVLSCGRFVEDDRFLYHVREGYPPFHVTSPTLPPGHVEGQRFSVYLRSACTTPEDVSRVRARREVVRFLELHDGCRPDEVLPALEPFPSMTVLEVHGARHADWLAALARHRKLVHLRVSLRGDASVALERLPTVRTLSLTAER